MLYLPQRRRERAREHFITRSGNSRSSHCSRQCAAARCLLVAPDALNQPPATSPHLDILYIHIHAHSIFLADWGRCRAPFMAANKDKVGVSQHQWQQPRQVVMELLDLPQHETFQLTHKSAETALRVGTRGAVIDMEMSEISLLSV